MSPARVKAVALIAALSLMLALAAATAHAATISTRYPGIDVRPGERVTLSLKVATRAAGEVVALEVASAPKGWQVQFKGGGFIVHRVFAEAGEPTFIDLQVRVPPDVKPGTYPLVVRASGPSGQSTLQLSLRVNPEAAAQAELSAEFPVLQGPSGANFEYRLELRNDSGEKKLFNLAAAAPEGFVVKFRPAYESKETTSIPVDAGSSERIDVTVETPQRVPAGTYPIEVRASAPGVEASTELKVVITGTYELKLKTPDERFSTRATAGRETPLKLILANEGTAPLHNVRLDAFEPTDWTVTFKPEAVDVIPPGETREVTAYIKPKPRALAGDYVMTIEARANEKTVSEDFRVTVTTPTTWGIVGLLLVAAAVAGTAHVFRTYGRR